jgi:hypothetical protein
MVGRFDIRGRLNRRIVAQDSQGNPLPSEQSTSLGATRFHPPLALHQPFLLLSFTSLLINISFFLYIFQGFSTIPTTLFQTTILFAISFHFICSVPDEGAALL